MNFNFQDNDAAPFLITAIGLFWLLVAIVHVAFAVGVFIDASNRRRVWFASTGIWTLATLLGGVFVAGVYWIIHYSTLNPARNPAQGDDRTDGAPDADAT